MQNVTAVVRSLRASWSEKSWMLQGNDTLDPGTDACSVLLPSKALVSWKMAYRSSSVTLARIRRILAVPRIVHRWSSRVADLFEARFRPKEPAYPG